MQKLRERSEDQHSAAPDERSIQREPQARKSYEGRLWNVLKPGSGNFNALPRTNHTYDIVIYLLQVYDVRIAEIWLEQGHDVKIYGL